jgi:hypothetical protein
MAAVMTENLRNRSTRGAGTRVIAGLEHDEEGRIGKAAQRLDCVVRHDLIVFQLALNLDQFGSGEVFAVNQLQHSGQQFEILRGVFNRV